MKTILITIALLIGLSACNKEDVQECPTPPQYAIPDGYIPVKWVGSWGTAGAEKTIFVYAWTTEDKSVTPWDYIYNDLKENGEDATGYDELDNTIVVDAVYVKVDNDRTHILYLKNGFLKSYMNLNMYYI